MSIDWSKYGMNDQQNKSNGIDWNKYIIPPSKSGYSMAERQVEREVEQPAASQIIYDEPAGPPNPVLPGRDLPVIGPVLRGLDWVASNPVSEAIAEYTVPDAPYLDQPGTNARQSFLDRSGQDAATGVPKFIGQAAAPFFVPGAGLGTGSSVRNAAENLTSRMGQGLGQTVAREAAIGGTVGFGSEFAQGEADPTQAMINAGFGAAGGAAFPLIGRGIQAAGSAAGRSLTEAAERPSLGTAVNDFMRRVNAPDEVPVTPNRAVESPSYQGRSLTSSVEGAPKQGYSDLGGDRFVNNFDRTEQYNSPQAQANRADSVLEQFTQSMRQKYDPANTGNDITGRMTSRERDLLSEYHSGLNGEVLRAPKSNVEDIAQSSGRDMQPAPRDPINLQEPAPSASRIQTLNDPNELRFTQTVRTSDNTPQELKQAVTDSPMIGSRTTDVLNRQQAEQLIATHGKEGMYSKLLSKKMHLSPAESTAAQMLAKQYANEGGKESLAKSIALVSKSAREGREMGQAIQALSQWNKLDETGALLLGERQLNRGVTDTAQWKSLTPEQAAPIQEAAQRVGTVQQTKNLAEEVLSIVTSKQPGEALSEAEKATIQQFQTQVKEINEKAKGFLPKARKAADETIKKVGDIKPKERTRDQVVSYLDAKAEKARQRLANQRNIGFAATGKGNPAIDLAIIGAAKLAKGAVKRVDFAEQMIKDFGQGIRPMIDEIYHRSVNMFRREHGLPTVEELDRVVNAAVKRNELTGEDAYQLKAWANEIAYMSDNFKVEATQDLQKALKALGTSTLGEKVSTVQTAAQLLNAVTIGRNMLGNTAQIALEKVNKVSAVPIDYALSKLTGNERTIQFFPQNQEKFWRNFVMGTKSGWQGVSPTGTLSSYDVHPDVFGKRNPLRYLTKMLGATLQGFDYAAYRSAYGDVVATYAEQIGKAKGMSKADMKQQMPQLIKNLDDQIHDLADQAGLYATFQDETLLSRAADVIKRGLNKPTDLLSRTLVDKGVLPKSLSIEGFGAGDIVLKYARTPANLIMRGIDYSPIGIIRSAMELTPLLKTQVQKGLAAGAKAVGKTKLSDKMSKASKASMNNFNQFEANRALSRAITGTLGLTGLGYLLADAGILSGSYSLDKDERSIQEQSGQGSYKVNWSALGRYITSGLDKSAAKYQTGDTIMDYAWLQPAAISLAMGVNANKAVKDQKEGEEHSGWKVAQDAILGGLSSVLENPMVQGLSNVIDAGTEIVKHQKTDKLGGILKGVPASFIPTLSNQARAATDNQQRETYSDSLLTEMGNLIKNKIPGLSKTLPVSYDSLGKPRERIQGGEADTVRQYLTSFFSPARITEYQVSPEAKMVLDLMQESGDKTVLPRISDRTIQVDDPLTKKQKTVKLTPEQYSRLQKQVGEETVKKLQQSAAYLSNPNNKLENKVNKVKDILSDVGAKARNDFRAEMGYKKKAVR